VDAEKRTVSAEERDEFARAQFRAQMADVDPARLVFLDETGTTTAMARRQARAPRGQRAHGRVPRNRGVVTTLIAALHLAGMTAAMTVEGATSGAVFDAYVIRVLVPSLRPGQIVVADNLAAHKSSRARAAIEAAGCQLVSLPAYSPDLNPIEEAFAKIKALLRAAAARSREALDAAIAVAMRAVTPDDAAGWFAHAGYTAPIN
jgi:transposase